MFEKRLKELSGKFETKKQKKFYILTHKKHKREIYFQNNKKAKEFLKNKLNSGLGKYGSIKKVVYFLIKFNLLQPFLKKIRLSKKIGHVVFTGGQIKGFDLKNKLVYSYPLREKQKENFIKSKQVQNQLSKEGFTPEIKKINERIPYSEEELLKEYRGGRDIEAFRKLMRFYKKQGIKKVPLREYIKKIMADNEIKNKNLKKNLSRLSKINNKILITKLHGDFAKENILMDKNKKMFFIDWNPEEGLITKSLINFFRNEEDLQKNKKFMRILKEVFPKEVQRDIRLYIKLHEINLAIKASRRK